MTNLRPVRENDASAIIKIAQYLSGLTTQQHIWSEAGKALVRFLEADVVAFVEPDPKGHIPEPCWTFSDQDFGHSLLESIQAGFGSLSGDNGLGYEVNQALRDVLESGFVAQRVLSQQDPLSLAFFPILRENQVTAVMLVGIRTSEPFSQSLLNQYLAVAGLVGTTAARLAMETELKAHRLHLEALVQMRTAQLRERIKEIECLFAISRLVAEPHESMDETLKAATEVISQGLQYPEITCAQISFQGRTFATENFAKTPWTLSVDIPLSGSDLSSPDASVVVAYLEERPQAYEGPFLQEERSLLTEIARQLGLMIERQHLVEKLRASAETDVLTGLWNRRFFQQNAKREEERAKRSNHPFSLVMLDIDHFKRVNDSLGHDAGDVLLQHLASLLKNNLRRSDIAARIGGEEFCLLLPETELESAFFLAERLRTKVEASPVQYEGAGIAYTISIGVSAWSQDVSSLHEVLRTADSAMYEAKAQGRNRSVKKRVRTNRP
jgi:diguanylate cyclase (GGDEF)-like protein